LVRCKKPFASQLWIVHGEIPPKSFAASETDTSLSKLTGNLPRKNNWTLVHQFLYKTVAQFSRRKMSKHRGTKLLSIPIRLNAYSCQLHWEIRRKDAEIGLEGKWRGPTTSPPLKIADGWELTRRFLSLNPDDAKAILDFLNEFGEFEPAFTLTFSPHRSTDLGAYTVVSERITKDEVVQRQDYLRRMLLSADPVLAMPWRKNDVQQCLMVFTRTRAGPQAEVAVRGIFSTMLATIQFKLLQGAKFKTCSRKDCRLPFEVESRHKRRFCSQYCAHITSLRSRRKLQRKAKMADEKVQRKGR